MSLDQSRLVNVPPGFGAGQMGNFALPGNNQTEDIIEEETLYDNAISHHIGAHPASAVFNIKTPLSPIQQNSVSQHRSTIPPHLIPLGPDGEPLLNSDGSPVIRNGAPSLVLGNNNQQQISDIFPFLKAENQHLHQLANRPPLNDSNIDTRDFLSRTINMVRDLPMDTRRQMLAGLMMGLPMSALTLATLGAPTMAIAPLALAIPGFLFAGFTETNPSTRSGGGGHGHHGLHGLHGRHGQHGGGHGAHGGHGGHHRRRGIAGLIDAVREFRRSQHAQPTSAATTNTGPTDSSLSRQADQSEHDHDHGHGHGHGLHNLFG